MSYLCSSLDPWIPGTCVPNGQQTFSKRLLNEMHLKLINLLAPQFFSGKITEYLAEVKTDKHKTLSLTEVLNK